MRKDPIDITAGILALLMVKDATIGDMYRTIGCDDRAPARHVEALRAAGVVHICDWKSNGRSAVLAVWRLQKSPFAAHDVPRPTRAVKVKKVVGPDTKPLRKAASSVFNFGDSL